MKISKFKKFISWNLISLIGYLSLTVGIFFLIMLSLASGQLNMRADLNGYFYDYILKHVFSPYFVVYKTQLMAVFILLILSVFEKSYYNKRGEFGLKLFTENEKGYTVVFVVGIILNFFPLYLFSLYILDCIMKIL